MLDQQDSGKQNLTLRLKQRALQGAYDTAVKKKKVCVQLVGERGRERERERKRTCARSDMHALAGKRIRTSACQLPLWPRADLAWACRRRR